MGLLSGLGGLMAGQGGDAMSMGLLPMLLQQQGGDQQQIAPPSAPMGGGLAGAFSGNPQFQQQLQAIQNGQGPGHQAPQFTPPPMQMSTAPPVGGQRAGGGRMNPFLNHSLYLSGIR